MDTELQILSICYNLGFVLLGLCVGSFLNVCIYRIPAGRDDFFDESIYAQGEKFSSNQEKQTLSILFPAKSICPFCKSKLLWWHNLPLIGWMILKGRCGLCQHQIPFRYPLVEALTGLMAALTLVHFGATPTGAVIFIFICALIVISFIDYDFYIIPNIISLPGTVIGVGLAGINHFFKVFASPIVPSLYGSFWGIALGAGFLWLVAEVYLRLRKLEGLGMGDVKLLAMTGALFGTGGAFYTIFIGSLLGSICGLALIIITGRKASQHIPFGPYLAIATVLYIFTGDDLINWWFGFLLGQEDFEGI